MSALIEEDGVSGHRTDYSRIIKSNNFLIALSGLDDQGQAFDAFIQNFCGTVVRNVSSAGNLFKKTVYLCGDISVAEADTSTLQQAKRVFVIKEFSTNFEGSTSSLGQMPQEQTRWPTAQLGEVPVLVHGVGVYYRRFFDSEQDFFNRIRAEHVFQQLTESTKPGTAHRTGIYLTPIERRLCNPCDGTGAGAPSSAAASDVVSAAEESSEELHFRLLRCSSNLSGPTGNFHATDRHIVGALNDAASDVFASSAPLNHVLAQIYHNRAEPGEKQTKAKIKAHSDKSKDMPGASSIMVFCTFYDQLEKLQPLQDDPFDYGVKGRSGLTQLHFELKRSVANRPDLAQRFSVTLYPNSAFMMPLSTNVLYTHEIRPSGLDAKKLPTRLGYVVRCSNTEAVFKAGQTFIKSTDENGQEQLVPLQPATPEGMRELRDLYAQENFSAQEVHYGPTYFSMNQGDYEKPALHEDFRWFAMPPAQASLFDELQQSVAFDGVTKGRKGAILVQPHATHGTPIVRTTTKYSTAAQRFQPVHQRLAEGILRIASLEPSSNPAHAFNNAMIENYTDEYSTMGFHSDQALDLLEDSSIAVFSLYKYPERAKPLRKLVIESKTPGGGTFEVPLLHNSVVVFNMDTNRRYRHKIVLDTASRSGGSTSSSNGSLQQPENEWLGLTFRTSKTFVRVDEHGGACLQDGTSTALQLADEHQQREFFHMRRRENQETDFVYPPLAYTISESDLMQPL